ncbi:MAG: hypothetical protein JST01_11100 [Cyanobacteria bacterium SZAS TMP-1]|nr:hypothetical protein [Cyanobacteria bacterium SZAS TMP-1]
MGDNPGRNQDFTGGQGLPAGRIDFESMINNGTHQRRPDAMPRALDQLQAPGPTGDAVKIGTDATNTVVITNKTLELSWKDTNFDNKLLFASAHGADKFNRIKINDLPPNVVVHTWIDRNGYFFWYDDGQKGPKAHHYLPDNALSLEANNAKIDLERERIKDNQQFAAENFGGFRNFDRNFVPSYDGTTNSTSYYWKMAGGSTEALAIQEHALRESVRNSDNPYFKIYLSDINAAQALKPLRDRAEQGLPYNVNNDYTRRKIDDALSLSKAAYEQTKGELGKTKQFPSLNVYLPLAPQRPYWDYNRFPNDYMGFWGGGFNQSYGRQLSLTSLRGLIMSNTIPRVHELPNSPN